MADGPKTVNSIVSCPKSGQSKHMKLVILTILAVAILTGCSPVSVYYKPNGVVTRKQSDLLSCQVDALSKAPVANQVRQGPPRYYPGQRYCGSDGRCRNHGGYWVSGEIYTVDVNASLRRDVEQQCMGQKGYQPVSLARCTTSSSSQTTPMILPKRMPNLTEQSCVAKDTQGNWQIIDPAG